MTPKNLTPARPVPRAVHQSVPRSVDRSVPRSVDRSVNTGVERFRPTLVDRALATAARALGWIPAPVLGLLGGRNADGDRLDGDIAASLLVLRLIGGEDISGQSALDARRNVDRQAYLAGSGGPAAVPVGAVDHRLITGVRVRVYTPENVESHGLSRSRLAPPDCSAPPVSSAPVGTPSTVDTAVGTRAPALFYFHGGGFVTGSLDSHDSTCRYLCARGGVRVFSVDYRMAPEHPFPAPLEDATAVVAAALGGEIPEVDPAKVVVAGDSAGAHLSAILTLRLRQLALPQPALQMLFAPLTDQRVVAEVTASHASRREFAEGPYLTKDHMRWYDEAYLGHVDAEGRRDPLISPLLAPDLSGLAPAYIAVAGHDPLRGEGEAYAQRLVEAGVPVTLRRHTGLVHPFVNSSAIWAGSRRALDEAVGALRAVLSI